MSDVSLWRRADFENGSLSVHVFFRLSNFARAYSSVYKKEKKAVTYVHEKFKDKLGVMLQVSVLMIIKKTGKITEQREMSE